MRTYAGESEVLITPVQPVAPVTVVLLLDQLNPAQFPAIEKDLLALYSSLRRHPLSVVLIRGGAVGVAGPFASRLHLKAALDDAAHSLPATSAPAASSAPSSLDALCLAVPQLGGKWSNALVVGEFPTLDPLSVEFASAMLLRAFTTQQVQLSWLAPSGGGDAWLPALRATGGNLVGAQLTNFAASLDQAPQFFFQVDWSPTAPASGFVVSRATLSDQQGRVVLETWDIASSRDGVLPSVEQYSAVQSKVAEAVRLLNEPSAPPESDTKIREILQEALQTNPRDPSALEIAGILYEKLHDYHAAAGFRSSLTEVRPQDPEAYAALGRALLLNGDLDKSEEALKRASTLGAPSPKVTEDLARVYLGKKNDNAALSLLDEALRRDPRRQDLWFLQAQTAERLGNQPLAMRSFQEGLALGGMHIPETAALIRLLVAAKRNPEAQDLAHRTVSALPPDGELRAQFASALDDLKQSPEALAAWKRVLEVRPDSDEAHDRIARLLLDSGDARSAEEAVTAGVKAAPKSAWLYVSKAEALRTENQFYEARRVLQQGAEHASDSVLLSRLAEAEDLSGGGAATYARLAESLAGSPAERQRSLERGFTVSVRDGDLQHAESFATLLSAAGHPEFTSLLGAEQHDEGGEVVPGGLDALAFVAHAGQPVSHERFFAGYCRAVLMQILRVSPNTKVYVQQIEAHFQRVAALEALGKRDGDRVVVSMTLNGKEERRRSEKILDLLGMTLHSSKGEIALTRGEKKGQAQKQETISALAIDEVAMQEAFQSGKPFSFEIIDERAPLYPNEKMWRETFYPTATGSGGFATAVLRSPKLGQLYLALSSLDRRSAAALISAVPLQRLDQRRAALLEDFGTAFAVEGSHAVVPGGRAAEPIWTSLVGVRPDQAGAFFRALLEHENGKLLAFFFTFSQLDRAHQAFFTANAERVSRFYKLFAQSQAVQRGNPRGNTTFGEVLRSVPLDRENHLKFPGSAEVWTAQNHSSERAKLLKKVSQAAAPEVEDEMLLRLAETRYQERGERHTELDNFLAVSHIDAHRREPLDQETALLLVQHFADFSEAYPYFTDLVDLQAGDFRAFFSAVEHIGLSPPIDANLRLGQLHSLVEWVCLLSRHHVVNDAEATKLFRLICRYFTAAENGEGYVTASLASARAILAHCANSQSGASADEQIRSGFIAGSIPANPQRGAEFQRILDLQGTPKLDTLFSIQQAAINLLDKGSGDATVIQKNVASLPSVELPKTEALTSKERESLIRYNPAKARKLAEDLRVKASKGNVNPKDIQKVTRELMTSLEPQVTAALAGPVYAYFLRPNDLIVREDPLLLRKHRYFDFEQGGRHELILDSNFNKESSGVGSYFSGGFAQFALAAGRAASIDWETPSPNSEFMIAAEIAAIRSAQWDQLQESDLRLVRLRTGIAREWIFQSATHNEEFRSLSEETMGLLSLARRAELLEAIEARNWKGVWNAITVPDLFALGGRFIERHKEDVSWPSPVAATLRALAASNNGSRLNALGAITRSDGCAHPHLQPNAPYEEYEHHLMLDDVAQRSAEFKIFLALQADKLGVQPSTLARVAESLAAVAFREVQMSDYHDWRSLLAGYSSVSTYDLARALE